MLTLGPLIGIGPEISESIKEIYTAANVSDYSNGWHKFDLFAC